MTTSNDMPVLGRPGLLPLSQLRLDSENPRLPSDQQGSDQEDLAVTLALGYDPFTVADVVLAYDLGAFRYGLNVDNIFNTRYDAAVRNQSIIVPGMGTNVKVSVTWKF